MTEAGTPASVVTGNSPDFWERLASVRKNPPALVEDDPVTPAPAKAHRVWSLGLLVGGLGLFASLYLPWRTASCRAEEYFGGQPTCGLLNLFSSQGSIDGIDTSVGDVAALFALAVAALAAAASIRPDLAPRLPLGQAAVAACYFGLAVGLDVGSNARAVGLDSVYAYGAYVGLAWALIILVTLALARRSSAMELRSASPERLAATVLVAGLLGSFLLPWWREAFPAVQGATASATSIGLVSPPAVVAAVLAILLAGSWPALAPAERVGLAGSVALFTIAAAVSFQLLADRMYGVWPALGLAAAVLVLAILVESRRIGRVAIGQLPWRILAVVAAAIFFVGSLFLPWQRVRYGESAELGPLAGHSFTTNGWLTTAGAAAAFFALALLAFVLWPHRLRLSRFELAGTFAVLVLSLELTLEDESGPGFRIEKGLGALVGSIAAGLLVALVALGPRPALDRRRVLVRSVPVAACLGYVVVVTLPWFDVVSTESEAFFALPGWTTIIGVLLAIRLLRLWVEKAAPTTLELSLLPAAMLGLASVILLAQREAITWGGAAVAILCALLATLGHIEQRQGLEHFRVPDSLRLDRL